MSQSLASVSYNFVSFRGAINGFAVDCLHSCRLPPYLRILGLDYTFIVNPRLARATANAATNKAYVASTATAVGVSASSVRMDMLTAPVARFATMKTGNRFKLIAAKICDTGRFKLQSARNDGHQRCAQAIGSVRSCSELYAYGDPRLAVRTEKR